jgi:group I intron endonuclease
MKDNQKKWKVYFHTNIINNKVYVGITSRDLSARWGCNGNGYLRLKSNGEFIQPKFARAILYHGWDMFEHIVFAEGLTKDEACSMEMSLINLYDSINNGYNITKGGEGGHGIEVSEEERRRRSEMSKGKHYSPNSEFKVGHTFTEETLTKMSEAKKGKPSWNKGLKGYNAGDKNPMKQPKVAAKFKGVNNANARRVIQMDMDGNYIARFRSISEAARETGSDLSSICNCCKGLRKSTNKYRWKYEN